MTQKESSKRASARKAKPTKNPAHVVQEAEAVVQKSRMVAPYVFVGVFLGGIIVYAIYLGWYVQQVQQAPAVQDEKEVVARTQPEHGEALSSSKIRVVGEEDAGTPTSITVHTPAPIVDVTAQLAVPPAELQAAEMAQATLKLAEQMNGQSAVVQPALFPVLTMAVYTAMNTATPEALLLLEKLVEVAPQNSLGHAQMLLNSVQHVGVIRVSDIKDIFEQEAFPKQEMEDVASPEKISAKMPSQRTANQNTLPLPTWWEKTLGQYITVMKQEMPTEAEVDTGPDTLATPLSNSVEVADDVEDELTVDELVRALETGQWQTAESLLESLPADHYGVIVTRLYISQRLSLVALLSNALHISPTSPTGVR